MKVLKGKAGKQSYEGGSVGDTAGEAQRADLTHLLIGDKGNKKNTGRGSPHQARRATERHETGHLQTVEGVQTRDTRALY